MDVTDIKSMNNRSPRLAFLVLLIILVAAFIMILRPFLLPILFAGLIVVICDPIYRYILRFLKKRYLASFVATCIVSIGILIPLGIVVAVVIINSSDAVSYVTQELQSGGFASQLDELNAWIMDNRLVLAGAIPEDFNIRAALIAILKNVGTVVYQYSPKVISATAGLFSGFLLTVIFILVFFAEGELLYKNIFKIIPLEDEHKNVIAREIKYVISGVFLGQMATSVAQGILIGLGFWMLGISDPLVWGLVAVGVTLIPVIGGPLMYVPASIAFIMNGDTIRGVMLLAYGIFIVSMVDNIIKPVVMRGKVNVHPVLLALSIIGGGLWLGASGIIIGPLVIALLISMLKIYNNDKFLMSND